MDKKNPTVSCGSADGSWHANNVDIACTASDVGSGLADSGDASFNLSTAVPAGTEDSNASTGSHDVSDGVGHTVTAGPITGNKIDRKAPQQASCDSADGAWHANNVTLHCTYTDGGSGPASQLVALSTHVAAGDETAMALASAGTNKACDLTGNCGDSPADIGGNKIDRKAPSITNSGPTTSPNAAGWYKAAVLNGFSATDGGSGLSSTCNSAFPKQVSTGAAEGTAVQVASGPCADAVGNTNAGIQSAAPGFKIDLTDPTVTCPAVPTFLQSQLPQTITANVSDTLSGPATPTASGTANTPSGGTVSITGQDVAGRSTTASCAYHVGNTSFLAPVDKAPTMNIAKLGRVVPIKINFSYDGAVVTGTGTVSVGGMTKVDCATGNNGDEIEAYAAGSSNTGNLFRWDPTSGFWIYNFDTSAFKMNAGNCYRINVYYGGTVSSGNASGGALVGYFLMQTTK